MRLALVLLLIGWKTGARVLSQSLSVVIAITKLLSTVIWKLLYLAFDTIKSGKNDNKKRKNRENHNILPYLWSLYSWWTRVTHGPGCALKKSKKSKKENKTVFVSQITSSKSVKVSISPWTSPRNLRPRRTFELDHFQFRNDKMWWYSSAVVSSLKGTAFYL